MKIYHAADIHLGRRRLDDRLPANDIVAAFRFIAEEAIREKADVFLLAGDLFDRPQVEPSHLRQAQEVLRRLKDAGITVIAIEGNHDKQFVNTDAPTWVRFLAEDDLLMLLRPEFHAEGVRLNEWNTNSRTGPWVEIGGVRFVGAGYLGAATPNKVRQIIDQMPAGKTHVLLLHAGPEYFVGEGGGFSKDDLQMLEDKVCYLALGHIHKPMLYAGWACNPGSPENCDLREAGYESIKQQLHDAALKHNRVKNTAKLAKFDILLNHEICSFEEAVTCDEAELRQRISNRVERFSRSIHPEIISFFKKQVAKSKESS